jgi:hypothetical protein
MTVPELYQKLRLSQNSVGGAIREIIRIFGGSPSEQGHSPIDHLREKQVRYQGWPTGRDGGYGPAASDSKVHVSSARRQTTARPKTILFPATRTRSR